MAKTDKEDARRNEQLERALRHAAGVGLGWFGLTLLTRQLIDTANKREVAKYDDKLRAYVNARYPIISPTFVGDTPEQEAAEQALGVPSFKNLAALESKTASDKSKSPSTTRTFVDKFINPLPTDPDKPVSLSNVMSSVSSNQIHPAHIAMTIAAALAGTAGGYALSSQISEKSRNKELDARILNARAEMDKMLFEEYRRTRGLDKAASNDSVEEDTRGWFSKSLSSIPKLYLLYAAGVGALTYAIGKNYMDEQDPERARLKALQAYAKERARMSGSTQIQLDPNDENVRKLLTSG